KAKCAEIDQDCKTSCDCCKGACTCY
nr:RecName: Full=U11-ctenitoxin-Co1b; Short=U11-CNTX-Co1b; AltName: Full=Neurotoxin Oc M9-7 [Oligoctenus ornatus]